MKRKKERNKELDQFSQPAREGKGDAKEREGRRREKKKRERREENEKREKENEQKEKTRRKKNNRNFTCLGLLDIREGKRKKKEK